MESFSCVAPHLKRQMLLYLEFSMLAECADQFFARLQPGNKDSGGLLRKRAENASRLP